MPLPLGELIDLGDVGSIMRWHIMHMAGGGPRMHVCSRPVAQPITALLNLYFPISTSRETKPVTQEIQLYNAVVFLANSCALSAPESSFQGQPYKKNLQNLAYSCHINGVPLAIKL